MSYLSGSKIKLLSPKQQRLLARCSDEKLRAYSLKDVKKLVAELDVALHEAGGKGDGKVETAGDVIARALLTVKRELRRLRAELKDTKPLGEAKPKPQKSNKRAAEKVVAASADRHSIRDGAAAKVIPLVSSPSSKRGKSQAEAVKNGDDGSQHKQRGAKAKPANSNIAEHKAEMREAKKAAREAERVARKAARMAERDALRESRKAARKAERLATKQSKQVEGGAADKPKKPAKAKNIKVAD